jgi:hypothetical protein
MFDIIYTTNHVSDELVHDFWKAYLKWPFQNNSCTCHAGNSCMDKKEMKQIANDLYSKIGANSLHIAEKFEDLVVECEILAENIKTSISNYNTLFTETNKNLTNNKPDSTLILYLIDTSSITKYIANIKHIKQKKLQYAMNSNITYDSSYLDGLKSFNQSNDTVFSYNNKLYELKKHIINKYDTLLKINSLLIEQQQVLKKQGYFNTTSWLENIFKQHKDCLNKYLLCCPEVISCQTPTKPKLSHDTIWKSNVTISRDTIFNRTKPSSVERIIVSETRTPKKEITPAAPTNEVPGKTCGDCQTRTICHYSTIVQPGHHQELIQNIILSERDPFNQVHAISNSSFEFDFNTRSASRVIFDFGGVFAYNRLDDYRAFVPYAGIMLDFRRYNRTVPYKLIQKSGGITDRLSFGIGVNLNSLAGNGRSNLLLDRISPLTHLGFRLGHAGKIVAGAMWYNKANISPGLPPRLVATPYIGLSIDFTLSKFITELGGNLLKLSNSFKSVNNPGL